MPSSQQIDFYRVRIEITGDIDRNDLRTLRRDSSLICGCLLWVLGGFFWTQLTSSQLMGQENNSLKPAGSLVAIQKSSTAPSAGVFQPKSLDRIKPGTVVFAQNSKDFAKPKDYSNLLLFVKGRLSEGDVNSVTKTTKFYADLFNLVYMANVKQVGKEFELEKVAIGFSSRINEKDVVVVTSATAKSLGLDLSIIGGQVLSGNEKALEEIKVVARSPRMMLIDAPTIFHFQGKNQKMLVRFYVWVSAEDGRVGTVVWLLKRRGPNLEFAQPDLVYLPPSMIEDRVMHVDGSQFTLGIPSPEAFGLVSLPKGISYKANDSMRKVGSLNSFTEESFELLSNSLADSMNEK